MFFSAKYALDEKGGAEKCRHFLLSKNTIGISQLYIHAAWLWGLHDQAKTNFEVCVVGWCSNGNGNRNRKFCQSPMRHYIGQVQKRWPTVSGCEDKAQKCNQCWARYDWASHKWVASKYHMPQKELEFGWDTKCLILETMHRCPSQAMETHPEAAYL